MARLLSQTLIKTTSSSSHIFNIHGTSRRQLFLSPQILTQRNRSSQSGKAQLIEVDLESEGDVETFGIRKLEDVIHSIMVKRSAPDWLPFVPGASYWVPPPSRATTGVLEVIGKLTHPLTDEECMSLSSSRGWPSSDYFIEGNSYTHSVPVENGEVEVTVIETLDNESREEDEEG